MVMESVLIKTTPEYEFYSDGRIWSNYKKDFLKGELTHDGYNRVKVYGIRKHRSFWIALAFIPNPDNLPEVNHMDENKLNDSVRNLEWCTSEYNCNYGTRNERIAKHFEIPVEMCDLNWKHEEYFPSAEKAAKAIKGSQGNITMCCQGKRCKHKGHRFRYCDPSSLSQTQ